jgi:hypothetical protein
MAKLVFVLLGFVVGVFGIRDRLNLRVESSNCHAFGCSTVPLTDETCVFYNYTDSAFQLQQCKPGYSCQAPLDPIAIGNYTCAETVTP